MTAVTCGGVNEEAAGGGGCGLGCDGTSPTSVMLTASGFRWGIPLSGGGGGPEVTGVGVAGLSSFSSSSEPVWVR